MVLVAVTELKFDTEVTLPAKAKTTDTTKRNEQQDRKGKEFIKNVREFGDDSDSQDNRRVQDFARRHS
jgi:hypothetical protein